MRCVKKYYYPEHEVAYRGIEREGKTGWDDRYAAGHLKTTSLAGAAVDWL